MYRNLLQNCSLSFLIWLVIESASIGVTHIIDGWMCSSINLHPFICSVQLWIHQHISFFFHFHAQQQQFSEQIIQMKIWYNFLHFEWVSIFCITENIAPTFAWATKWIVHHIGFLRELLHDKHEHWMHKYTMIYI